MRNTDKVVLGMSGGVDSSVAAAVLLDAGYEVLGVTEIMSGYESVEEARSVAETLGIPFRILDLRQQFHREVVTYFKESYLAGETPNPCLRCNRYVKWQGLVDAADEWDAYYIATGHYSIPDRGSLRSGGNKDQSYALCFLTKEQLERTLMPLGGMTKDQVRRKAAELGLSVAEKPDSMEICFIPDHDHAAYLGESRAGNFVDRSGKILGPHKGIAAYTIGQRKGLGLALGEPVYVTEIRPDTGEVVLGSDEDLMTTEVWATQVNLTGDLPETALGKIRYNHKGALCRPRLENGILKCSFLQPVRAAAPGQALVLYDGDRLLGGGIIIRKK